jgi:ribosomal protein S18 acetylase RimI-like enzyme
VIRSARSGDVQAIVELWMLAGLQVDPVAAAEELRSLVRARSELVLVAEEGSLVSATVMGTWDGRRGWLQRLATRPDREGRGLGRALVAELERRLQALGCAKVNLLIEADNAAVTGFYARLGFARDDLVFMEKWLERPGLPPV